jgi:hypothetical protein
MKDEQVPEEELDDVQEEMNAEERMDEEREDAEMDKPGPPGVIANERDATPDAQVSPADNFEMLYYFSARDVPCTAFTSSRYGVVHRFTNAREYKLVVIAFYPPTLSSSHIRAGHVGRRTSFVL